MEAQELIERYAEINGISIEEATTQIGGETSEEILQNIKEKTTEKINESMPKMNRAQRRAWKKKHKNEPQNEIDAITETAVKLNYIDLIQRLRELNEKRGEGK